LLPGVDPDQEKLSGSGLIRITNTGKKSKNNSKQEAKGGDGLEWTV